MQISKKKLVAVVVLVSVLCTTITYALVTFTHSTPVTFSIVSSTAINVTDAVSGENWTSWALGENSRAAFPISSGTKNITYLGDSPTGTWLSWTSSGFNGNVTVTAERLISGSWTPWECGDAGKTTMGVAYPLQQVRYSISVLSTIGDGTQAGAILITTVQK